MKDMKRINVLLITLLTLVSCSGEYSSRVDVIPHPAHVEVSEKICEITGLKGISADPGLESEALLLQDALAGVGVDLNLSESGRLVLKLDRSLPCPEAYTMTVTSRKVVIAGASPAGVFYGMQTLLQQMRAGGVRCGYISDSPRFAWRGYMLDEARHFSGTERVKQLLDMMAYYKLNRFHWHLTDGQGWRIEIKKYPKLALVGGEGCHSDPDTPAVYYTQDEIRDIVEYASARHIEIVPEIDMPGHATAATKAYPEYNGGGTEQFPDFTFNVGKEETYAFLTDILREVSGLFPGTHIHIGGDEVFYGSEAWKKDPYVQAMMKREGLSTIKQAEGYFINRMVDSVKVLGKRVIGWDDMLDFDLDKEAVDMMWWRHDRPQTLRKCIDLEFKTVLCPRKPLYFDFIQHENHKWGRIWDGFCPLEDVYAFPETWFGEWGVTAEDFSDVLGIQANSWTELMHTEERVEFMTYPRICALAESAWTLPEIKDYDNFLMRLEKEYALFDELDIYCFDARDPDAHAEPAGPVIRKKGEPKMDFRD